MPSDGATVPSRVQVVVVGGGIIGTSIAYHLAKLGCPDVVLLERDRLTSGTTWHAAGLMVTFGSMSETSTSMRRYTRDLYARLEAETGLSTGFKPVGFIEVAADEDRLEEYRRVAAFNRLCGVDVHEISPREVAELFPLADVSDIHAGFYVPDDGRVNPVDATMSLARGARMRGVQVIEGVAATGVEVRDGRVVGVHTDEATIECETAVLSAGMWTRQLAQSIGVSVPLQAAEHYYLITEAMEGIDPAWPVLEDPSRFGYYREEVGGLMIGLFEPECAPWNVGSIPTDFSFGQIPPDWDRMAPHLATAMSRVPAVADAGIRTFFCGPESFTPDLAPIVGEAPEVDGLFIAAGLNSIGILTGGGLGRAVAQWIIDGRPDVDVTGMAVDRLHPYQSNPAYRASRTVESLGMVYQAHYPGRSMQTARGIKRSAIHERLAAAGAYFRDVSGWEGADWFAPAGVAPQIEKLSWGRQNWFDYWRTEHETVRTGVGLMDMSFMSKFQVQGPDAGRLLEWVCANRVDGECGVITYTQWLNEGGLLEADLTVTKLSRDRFWVVASDTAHRHVEAWLRRQAARIGARADITDLTSAYAQLNVQGPLSREVMQAATSHDMSNDAFPYRAVHEIDLGFARAQCARITYLGELGYELYIPTEMAMHAYEHLLDVGTPLGLRHVGLKSLASLRMEKAYRDYGHDIDNTDNPFEAGLGFAVAMDKPQGFCGHAALVTAPAPARRRAQVLVTEPEPLMIHVEVVRRDGLAVGYIRAASYGFTLGGAVGLAMVERGSPVDAEWIASGEWAVEIAGQTYPARASLSPLYDPRGSRIRA